jgi:hypothetical protein
MLKLAISLTVVLVGCNKHITRNIIEKQISSEGISVIYTDGKDTFALDYLTYKEYDSLINPD